MLHHQSIVMHKINTRFSRMICAKIDSSSFTLFQSKLFYLLLFSGVMQLNSGLYRLNEGIVMGTGTQIIIIWCVTAIATISVISGLRMGIKVSTYRGRSTYKSFRCASLLTKPNSFVFTHIFAKNSARVGGWVPPSTPA